MRSLCEESEDLTKYVMHIYIYMKAGMRLPTQQMSW